MMAHTAEKGVVTVGVEKVIQREHVDKVLAIGPPVMMKFTSLLAKKYGIPNDVSLNTIMVDGTGMCGACRLTIGGKTRFVCIDGPEFNGDQVDWDEMFKRMGTFKNEESLANRLQSQDTLLPIRGRMTVRNVLWELRRRLRRALLQRQWGRTRGVEAKERVAIPRVKMPELDAEYRAKTRLEEVNIGLTPEMAMQEAKRCLDCKKPSCVEGCPVNIQIPKFIKNIERGTSWKQRAFLRKHQLYQLFADAFVHRRNSVRAVVYILK